MNALSVTEITFPPFIFHPAGLPVVARHQHGGVHSGFRQTPGHGRSVALSGTDGLPAARDRRPGQEAHQAQHQGTAAAQREGTQTEGKGPPGAGEADQEGGKEGRKGSEEEKVKKKRQNRRGWVVE